MQRVTAKSPRDDSPINFIYGMEIPFHVQQVYQERHRRYHDLAHIQYMLHVFLNTQFNPEPIPNNAYREAIIWAVLYHDYVYSIPDPEKMNEEMSARAFERVADKDDLFTPYIAKAIRGTKTHLMDAADAHDPVYFIIASHLFDLDLWALGDEELYAINNEKIKIEVGATEEQWAVGRSLWIEQFLNRKQIYYTELGQAREDDARRILEADYKDLIQKLK